VAFSPDRKTLASGSADGIISFWGLTTARPIDAPLTSNTSPATSVAFSPDGKTLATGNDGGIVRLWDVASHRQITTLTGPARPVTSVAFSPDGTTLATGSGDGTVRLWDLATRHPIRGPLTGPAGRVFSVAFSPDGKILAIVSADGTLRLWDVAYLVNVVPHLCTSVGRSVTRAEWARYVPGPAYQRVCPKRQVSSGANLAASAWRHHLRSPPPFSSRIMSIRRSIGNHQHTTSSHADRRLLALQQPTAWTTLGGQL